MPEKRTKKTSAITAALFAFAAVLIAVGAFGGGFLDTMRKAIVICLECIGIG